jgi:SulP family sulfate permease
VAAVVIAVVMLFFTETLAYLPNAALAGIVANAVLSLVEVKEFREFWQVRRSEFWVALICLMGVLVLGPLRGVLIAFLMAVIDLLGRASRPGTWVLRESADGGHLEPAVDAEGADHSGLVVYRFGASLFFANANVFSEDIERLTAGEQPVRWFVLDAEAMMDMDTSGAEAVHVTLGMLDTKAITFGLSRANPPLLEQIQRYGLLDYIDPSHIFETNRDAVAAYRKVFPDERSKEDQK